MGSVNLATAKAQFSELIKVIRGQHRNNFCKAA